VPFGILLPSTASHRKCLIQLYERHLQRLPVGMTAIFISHSSADNAAAAEMKAWLEAQGHTSLFLDFDPEAGIKGGSAWKQTLYQQLRQCQAVIALLTPNWLASKWCFAELVLAQERGKEIFPVKVQPCAAGGVFSDIQHIDLTAEPEEGYRRLKIGLLERGLDPLDVFDWDPKRPPYPGLLAFQEQDAGDLLRAWRGAPQDARNPRRAAPSGARGGALRAPARRFRQRQVVVGAGRRHPPAEEKNPPNGCRCRRSGPSRSRSTSWPWRWPPRSRPMGGRATGA
jgi:hypothetical protein